MKYHLLLCFYINLGYNETFYVKKDQINFFDHYLKNYMLQ